MGTGGVGGTQEVSSTRKERDWSVVSEPESLQMLQLRQRKPQSVVKVKGQECGQTWGMKSRWGSHGNPDCEEEKHKAERERTHITNQTPGASEGLSDAQG